ncbi:hypothetical protein ILUMI_09371 [Ignelater luminosus]|uniref:PiggyBac transposable element-derived protein domain-containing protein n=1 Tax=Ignelater luminosus TaxID=2038154 RepID=A0A8K0GG21_IGNLU|nr:hypothetical protein ILUMI_09371 [Ignelater luminosus]
MMNEIPDTKRKLPYNVFFDNLFTSANLLNYLRQNGYGATGIIQENCVPKNCPLPNKQTINRQFKRGENASTLDGILFIRWLDNNVTLASMQYGVNPVGSVKRFSQKEKIIQVRRPYGIGEYNKYYMGVWPDLEHDINIKPLQQTVQFGEKRQVRFSKNECVMVKNFSNTGPIWALAKIIKHLGHQESLIRMQNKRLSKRHVDQMRNTLVTANTAEEFSIERVSDISDLNCNVNRCNSKLIQDESDFNGNEATQSIRPYRFKDYVACETYADWENNESDRKSYSGFVFKFGEGPINWEAKKQNSVSLFSTESEYVAISDACREAIFRKGLLQEMYVYASLEMEGIVAERNT